MGQFFCESRLSFANDLLWLLVFAQAQENRLPQDAVAGPLQEFHLAHQLRLEPCATVRLCDGEALTGTLAAPGEQLGKRTVGCLQFLKLVVKQFERASIEPRADLPGKQQWCSSSRV